MVFMHAISKRVVCINVKHPKGSLRRREEHKVTINALRKMLLIKISNISLLIERRTLNKIDTKRRRTSFSTFQKAAKNNTGNTLCGLTLV